VNSPARRTQEERRETTREALLRASVVLIANRGVGGASLQDVSERAGVTKGALVHHFEHKDALLDAVVDRCAAALCERVTAAWSPTLAPWARVRAALDAVFTLARDTEGEGRCLVELAVSARTDPRLATKLGPRVGEVVRAFARGLAQSLSEMGVIPRTPPETLAEIVWTTALGAALREEIAATQAVHALEVMLVAHFVP
jgi:AcrR family transcriptional regulator